MKDLYARAGLAPEEFDPEVVWEKVKGVRDGRDRRDAEIVLLSPHRREVYDRNHLLLRKVGCLRAKLGVYPSRLWKETSCGDFERGDLGEISRFGAVMRSWSQRDLLGDWKRAVRRFVEKKRKGAEAFEPPFQLKRRGWVLVGVLGVALVTANLLTLPQVSEAESPERVAGMPENGLGFAYFDPSAAASKIVVSASPDGLHYWLKLESAKDRELVYETFLMSGESVSIPLPAGNYRIKVASGEHWLSARELFGEDTQYVLLGGVFSAREKGVYESIDLRRRSGGNLRLRKITGNEF